MGERSYTVAEIDALRAACTERYVWGSSVPSPKGGVSRCFAKGEVEEAVERLVRTHMMAGHTAEDLIAEDQRRIDERNKAIAKAKEATGEAEETVGS